MADRDSRAADEACYGEGIPVVMDLSAMPEDEGRQLVDFAEGLVCARGGDMERLSPKVFMLVPAGLAKPGAAANEAEESA
jgi:FtsZ-interacting cell division protein YlmF